MMSVHNWLGFSLSPHPEFDTPEHSIQQQSSITSLSMEPGATKLSEPSISYDHGSSDCYVISEATAPSPDQIPRLSSNHDTASLHLMEAFSQAAQTGDPSWPASFSQSRGSIPSAGSLNFEHLFFTPYPTPKADLNQGKVCDPQWMYAMLQPKTDQPEPPPPPPPPKLEDFLGGVSVGAANYAPRNSHHASNLQEFYYASCGSDDPHAPLPTETSLKSAPQIHSFKGGHLHFDPVEVSQNALLPSQIQHSGYVNFEQQDQNVCAETDRPIPHAQNLLHEALGTCGQGSFFSGGVLQAGPHGSSAPAVDGGSIIGISALKSWLRQHQSNADYAETSSNDSKTGGGAAIANLQSLALSMSPASQSSSVAEPHNPNAMSSPTESKKRPASKAGVKAPPQRKSADAFGQRTSIYRGVTRHRWTGRYEAHLWDNSCKKEGQTRKGRQVYLGGYDKEEKAARAYDLAALKYWGPTTTINFPLGDYVKELEEMRNMTRQEYVASLRRKSSGFSRGASIYRGVTRHHQQGRWQARIGRVAGNKDLYLGTFSTQEEAAEAYDVAAIKFRGISTVTNFEISRYDVKRICSSPSLLLGDTGKCTKEVEVCDTTSKLDHHHHLQLRSKAEDLRVLEASPPPVSDLIHDDPQDWQNIAAASPSRQLQQSLKNWYDQGVQQQYLSNAAHSYQNFLNPTRMPPAIFHALPSDIPCSNTITTITKPPFSSAPQSPCHSTDQHESKQTHGLDRDLLQGDPSGPYQLFISQSQPPSLIQNNILGSVTAPAIRNMERRPIFASPHMPIFAVWNDT